MDQFFYQQNRKAFIDQMSDQSMCLLFAGVAKHRSADQSYEFTPNRNFFYLTGLTRSEFIVLLSKMNGKVEETLFITRPNPDIEKWTGIRLRVEEAQERSGIETVLYEDQFTATFHRLVTLFPYQKLYLDTVYREDNPYTKGLEFARFVEQNYPSLAIQSADYILHDLRTIKKEEEIAQMKEAIRLTNLGIQSIMKNCRPNMVERQLDAHFEFTIKYNGANGKSFRTIAASGKNATILHYEENDQILKDQTLVLLDLGSEFNHYCADISRTIPVNGKFTDRQKAVYESVLRVNEAMIERVKPGLTFKEFLGTAKDMLADECIKLGLIKDKADVGKYYYHGVGHLLGLDVHDVGRNNPDRAFEPGMVVTVEPGLYIAEESIGVRIEDDVLVTETGHINLSQDIIKSVKDIESFMQK